MGYYNISFEIRDVKDMVSPNGENTTIDPLIVVRCAGLEYRTEIKYDRLGLVNFDCSHSWPAVDLTAATFAHAIIEFELQSANAFWANTVVGIASVQLTSVQKHTNHTISGYIPLNSPSDSSCTGNLNMTLSVLSSNDIMRVEEVTEEARLDETMETVIIRSGKQKQTGIPHHLIVSVYKLELGTSGRQYDVFITCEFAGCHVKSPTRQNCTSVLLNEGFRIPVTTPLLEDSIVVGIWDDGIKPPVLLARGSLSFLLVSSRPLSPRWFNLYGFSESLTAHQLKKVSDLGIEGNVFIGRLLIGATAKKIKSHSLLGSPELVQAKGLVNTSLQTVTYFAEVYEVDVNFEKLAEARQSKDAGDISQGGFWTKSASLNDLEIYLVLSSGIVSTRTKVCSATKITAERARYTFDESTGSISALAMQLSGSAKNHPDVFLEVRKASGERLAYRRFTAADIPILSDNLQTCPPLWVPLRNIYTYINDNQPINVLLSIDKGCGRDVTRRRRRRIIAAQYVLRCYIYAARFLPFLNPGDLSDGDLPIPSPYVEISCTGSTEVTPPAESTRFPIWLKTVELNCRLMIDANDGIPALCPILVEVKNFNDGQVLSCAVAGYTRLVGRKQAQAADIQRLKPNWIHLANPSQLSALLSGSPTAVPASDMRNDFGDILLAIEVLRKQDAPLLPPQSLMPPLKSTIIRVSLWGLRDLIPPVRFDQSTPLTLATLHRLLDSKTSLTDVTVEIHIPVYSENPNGSCYEHLTIPYENLTTAINPSEKLGNNYLTNAFWEQTEYMYSCNMHYVTGMEAFLPVAPYFDPHVIVRTFDGVSFLGETAYALCDLLPWFQKGIVDPELMSQIRDQIQPKQTFEQSLGRLRDAYTIALTRQRRENLEKEYNVTRKMINEVMSPDENVDGHNLIATETQDAEDTAIAGDDGIPWSTKKADQILDGAGYNVRPFIARCVAPGVYIPPQYVLLLEGKNRHRIATVLERDVIKGCAETGFPDIYWRPKTLWRPGGFRGGSVKLELALTAEVNGKQQMQSNLPGELIPVAFSNKRFRTEYRGAADLELLRVRVYAIRIAAMSCPKTIFSDGSVYDAPYNVTGKPIKLQIQVNEKRNDYLLSKSDGPSPKFYGFYEIDVRVPHESIITISAWAMEGDQRAPSVFCGSTRIDILDRYYSAAYDEMLTSMRAPFEIRPLAFNDTSNYFTGSLEMLLEVFRPSLSLPRMPLVEEAPGACELRIVIWGCRGLVSAPVFGMDNEEGEVAEGINVLVRCMLDSKEYNGSQSPSQQTDVHYGSLTGTTVYNWRCVFSDIQVPTKSAVVTLAAVLFRTLGADVVLGQVNLELKGYMSQFASGIDAQKLNYDVELRLTDQANRTVGFIQTTISFVSQQQARLRPAGLGQESPNNDPTLVKPIAGRRWGDFLGGQSAGASFSQLWLQIRWLTVFLCFCIIIVVGCLKPGIFWSLKT